jgi:Leucine-rich repeat (LRR) protein
LINKKLINKPLKYSFIYNIKMIHISYIDKTDIFLKTFDEIVNHDKIISLFCNFNKLTTLPNMISLMTNLEELHCTFNSLTKLPDYIFNLTKLKSLKCSYNRLTELPSDITNLVNLTCLDISCNDIDELPLNIGYLVNLKELNFYNTNILTLPDSIINLRNMVKICDFNYKTPLQEKYYDWIKSNKSFVFDEYYDDFLIKSALKCS